MSGDLLNERSASGGAPVKPLYRHALESIFKFCSLKELHAILTVRRDWSAAVVSMPSIGATHGAASMDQLTRIAGSQLSRHIVEIRGVCASSPEGLRLLADRMPWIRRHWFVWLPEHNDCVAAANTLSRLRQLKSLQVALANVARKAEALTIESMDQHAAAANHLIRAAACMPMLEDLSLILLFHDARILLSPLIALPELRALVIVTYTLHSALPSDEQVAALRAMHSLQRFEHSFTDRNSMLRLLLQSPIPPFRWTKSQVASGGGHLVPLLQSLPDLTELDVECRCGDVSFLLSLPRVVELTLRPIHVVVGSADLAPIVATLRRCTQLTVHYLDRLNFTSAQLAELLPALPHLSNLSLLSLPELTSLQFLATDALAASLTGLFVMTFAHVPSAEFVHLLGLSSLRSLILFDLREPLSEEQEAQLRAVHPFVRF